MEIPKTAAKQKQLLRSLFNVRKPKEATAQFLSVQDEYLQEVLYEKGITDISSLTPNAEGYIFGRVILLR